MLLAHNQVLYVIIIDVTSMWDEVKHFVPEKRIFTVKNVSNLLQKSLCKKNRFSQQNFVAPPLLLHFLSKYRKICAHISSFFRIKTQLFFHKTVLIASFQLFFCLFKWSFFCNFNNSTMNNSFNCAHCVVSLEIIALKCCSLVTARNYLFV